MNDDNRVRGGIAAGHARVELRILAERTELRLFYRHGTTNAEAEGAAGAAGAEDAAARALPIGAGRTARECLRHAPPNALDLERAIATIEDAVMPLRPLIATDAALFASGDDLARVARFAGVPDDSHGTLLTLDMVERAYQRLAAVAEGRPASREQLPPDGAFAASLLILREFMHHMGFASVTLHPSVSQIREEPGTDG